ncbi:MAG: vWA domain-containing protein [Candidatus Thorarchaeota archaeon]
MKGRLLYSVPGIVALLLVLTYVGGVQQSQDLVNNKDVHVKLSYDNEISFDYLEEDPKELFLEVYLGTKPVDVVLVVDISGTMAAGDVPYGKDYFSRLQVAKRAINAYMMDVIDEKSLIKLITFGPDISVSEWESKNDTIDDVRGLIEGGTLSRGADALFEAINQILAHDRRSELVLLTDGVVPETSEGDYLYPDIKPHAEENNIKINVVLIGTEPSYELEDLAAQTGGFFIWIKEAILIENVKEKFEEKYSTSLENVTISLQPSHGNEIQGSATEELGTLPRGTTQEFVYSILLKKPQKSTEQTIAALDISYDSVYGSYEETFNIGANFDIQTKWEYYLDLIQGKIARYRYHIIGGLLSLFILILFARYLWVSYKRSQWVLQADNFFKKAHQKFSSREYEDALPLYEKALELYTCAKNKEKQNSCKKSMKECKNAVTTWIQKSSELDTIIEEIEANKDLLKRLLGYQPPGKMYEWFFANVPSIKPLFGPENMIDEARNHIKERDITEIKTDILVLKEKLEQLKEIASICETNKSRYENNRKALRENLIQFIKMDVSYICKFCDISEMEALFYLNFLIDENLENCTDYDRNCYIEVEHLKDEEIQEKPEEVSPAFSEEIEQKNNFVSQYLEEDVHGIEKIEILRKTINASEEEMASVVHALQDVDENRYYIDWYEEEVMVDYLTLKNYIHNAFKKGQNISDIIQTSVNKCTIPTDVQKRIINDSKDW